MRKKHTVVELAVYGALAFIFLSCNPSWAIQMKNGSTAVVSFLARNASNLSQYITGLTTGTTNITVYRKNLSALSMTTNTLSEVANGLYRITLNATHTNTTGELVYRINWSSGDYWGRDDVVDNLASDVYAKADAANTSASAANASASAANNTVGSATYGNSALRTALGNGTVVSSSVTGNIGGNVNGSVASVTGNVGGNVGGNVNGSVSSVVGNVGGNLGGNVNGSVASVTGNVTVTNCDVATSTRGVSNLTTSDLSNLDVAISTRGTGNLTTTDLSNAIGSLNNISAADVWSESTREITGGNLTQAFPANFSSMVISGAGAVTAGTVSDKAGYSLSSAGLADFFDTNSGTTYASAVAGSVVKEIADNAVGSAGSTDWTAGEKADILAALGVTDGEATQTLDTLYTEIKKARR